MVNLWNILTVIFFGAWEIWEGIPIGIALGMTPLQAGFITFLGATACGIFVTFLGPQARDLAIKLFRRIKEKVKRKKEAIGDLAATVKIDYAAVATGEEQPSPSPQPEAPPKKEKLINRIWNRYGVVGLGIMAPLITGVALGAMIGVSLGAPPRKLITWLTVGAFLWSAGITAASALGLEGFNALFGKE